MKRICSFLLVFVITVSLLGLVGTEEVHAWDLDFSTGIFHLDRNTEDFKAPNESGSNYPTWTMNINGKAYAPAIKTVYIDEGVTYVGRYSFGYVNSTTSYSNMTNLQTAYVADSVEMLASYSLYAVQSDVYIYSDKAIFGDNWVKKSVTIHGYPGSTAETYAKYCGNPFVAMCKEHEPVVENAVEATCTEAGYSGDTYCAVCGEFLAQGEVVDALGHAWDEGKAVTPATCEGSGEQVCTCTRCGEERTEQIPQIKELKLDQRAQIYDGKAKKPSVTVLDIEDKVIDPSNYEVSYSNNINATEADDTLPPTVTVTFVGAYYDGTMDTTFEIEPKAITPKVTQSSSSLTYNGNNRSPSVSVYDGDKKLTKYNASTGEGDYKISMATTHKNVGKWTITVTLCGNYSGTAKTTFNIIPKGTTLASLTAKSKAFTVKWNKQTEKMSSSVITGYQIQWSTTSDFSKDNHTKKVPGYSTTSYTIDSKVWSGIKGSKKYYVRIRTYKTTSSGTYYSSWSSKKVVTTKK